MNTALDLSQMTTEEKLRALEALWTDLSQNAPESIPAPQWHDDVLQSRARDIKEGKAMFNAWPDVKARLRDRLR